MKMFWEGFPWPPLVLFVEAGRPLRVINQYYAQAGRQAASVEATILASASKQQQQKQQLALGNFHSVRYSSFA